MKNVFRVCLSFLCALNFFLFSYNAFAASLGVSPLSLQLSSSAPIDNLKLNNLDKVSILIQIKKHQCTQKDGADVYASTDDIVVTPPVFSLASGSAQVIRVGLLKQASLNEEAVYRLMIQEVPKKVTKRSSSDAGISKANPTIQMLLRIAIPVFVAPAREIKTLAYRALFKGPQALQVSAINTGNVHVSVSDVALYIPGQSAPFFKKTISSYILPHQASTWIFNLPKPLASQSVKMVLTTNWGEEVENLSLKSP